MKDMEFDGKKCLITGVAGGIGRAAAIAMARLGARLFLTDVDEARSKVFPSSTGSG